MWKSIVPNEGAEDKSNNDLVLFTLFSVYILKLPWSLLIVTLVSWSGAHSSTIICCTKHTLLSNYFPCCVIWGIKGTETERNGVISVSPRYCERTGSALQWGGEEERQEGRKWGRLHGKFISNEKSLHEIIMTAAAEGGEGEKLLHLQCYLILWVISCMSKVFIDSFQAATTLVPCPPSIQEYYTTAQSHCGSSVYWQHNQMFKSMSYRTVVWWCSGCYCGLWTLSLCFFQAISNLCLINSLDWLQPPADLHRISGIDNECIDVLHEVWELIFIWQQSLCICTPGVIAVVL